jgi:hypothetical protein
MFDCIVAGRWGRALSKGTSWFVRGTDGKWDPKTGEAAHNPAAKIAVYQIRVEGDDVMVEL